MTPMQSSTKKLTLVLLCCLAFAGFAGLGFCEGGGGGRGRRPMMEIQPPMAPVAQGSIPDQRLYEGAAETLDVEPYFTDPDSESLTYRVASRNVSVATVTVSGSVVTIRGIAAGTAEVRVTVTDPGGLTAHQDFTVRVEAVAAPPVARGAIPDQRLYEGATETLDVERYFTDPDSESLTYSVASGNASAATVTVSGSVVTIRGIAAGTAEVRVTATDPGGLTAHQDFTVRVEAVAAPPVARGAIPDQMLDEGATKTLDVERYFTDPDSESLTYSVAVSGNASVATVTVSGSVVTIRGHVGGTAEVRVTATDPGGLTAYQDFTIAVAASPVAQGAIPDQTLYEGATETLDVERYFTDPDSESLTYSVASRDASVATVTVSGSVVTIRGHVAGTAEVRVTATDPGGLTAYQDFTVRVEAVAPLPPPVNVPPRPVGTISIPGLSLGGTHTFDVAPYFTDPNGDRLTYSVARVVGRFGENPSAVTVTVSGSTVTITAGSTMSAVGTVTWRVTATDPGGLSAPQEFNIIVDTSV